MTYFPTVKPASLDEAAAEGRVRRVYSTESKFDRAWLLDPENGVGGALGPERFATMLMGAHLIDGLRARGLKVDRSTEVTVRVDDHGDLIRENKVLLVVTVEAEGLEPEERLPRGWRAFFCAP